MQTLYWDTVETLTGPRPLGTMHQLLVSTFDASLIWDTVETLTGACINFYFQLLMQTLGLLVI